MSTVVQRCPRCHAKYDLTDNDWNWSSDGPTAPMRITRGDGTVIHDCRNSYGATVTLGAKRRLSPDSTIAPTTMIATTSTVTASPNHPSSVAIGCSVSFHQDSIEGTG